VPRVCEVAKAALADNKCVVIGLQTTGEARLNDAVKSNEDLDEFAGMKEVVRFLLKKFPTGDYIDAYPESDYDEAEEDEEDKDLAAAVAGATARQHQSTRPKRRGRRPTGEDSEHSSEEEEDEDDTLDGFIVGDEDGEDSDESEYEDEQEGDAEARAAKSIKLPVVVKKMPKAQLRELLRAAKVPDQQLSERPQLIHRLKQVERAARGGSGLTVAQLVEKAGLDGKGKRASPEGGVGTSKAAAAGPQGRPKRLRKATPKYAGQDSDNDDEAAGDEDEPIDLDDDAGMSEAAPEVGENGLIGKTLRIKDGAKRRVGKVVAFDTRLRRHTVKYDDSGESVTLDLGSVTWNMHNARAAPGASGRALESSDEEDLLDAAIGKGAPGKKSAAAGRGKAKAKAKRAHQICTYMYIHTHTHTQTHRHT